MDNCEKADPGNYLKYYKTLTTIDQMQATRLLSFLPRRGLTLDFLKEDTAGKR
jgi:hypothetical protein